MSKQRQSKGYVEGGFRFFFLNDRSHQQIDYHHHTFHKCVIVYQGHVSYTVEGNTYVLGKGDVLWVPSYEAHKVEVFDDLRYKRLVVYMSEGFVESLGSGLAERLKKVGATYEQQDHLEEEELYPYNMAGNGPLDQIGAFIPWMGKSLKSLQRLNHKEGVFPSDTASIPDWVQTTTIYIRNHLDQKMTVETLAQMAYLNQHYFMHRFKEVTGTSVHQYILQERLKVARGLMKQGESLTDIAYASGFNSYATFARAFKKVYAMSPRAFMKMHPVAHGVLKE